MDSKGVTLVELVVVLAVVGILGAIAVPALHSLLQEQQGKVVAQELAQTLRTARLEAILRHSPVVVRASREGWGHGWTTLIDRRGLRLHAPKLDGKVPIVGNRWVREEVRFNSFGAPAGVGRQSNLGSLFICDPKRLKLRWRVVISWAGRVRITDKPDPDSANLCTRWPR